MILMSCWSIPLGGCKTTRWEMVFDSLVSCFWFDYQPLMRALAKVHNYLADLAFYEPTSLVGCRKHSWQNHFRRRGVSGERSYWPAHEIRPRPSRFLIDFRCRTWNWWYVGDKVGHGWWQGQYCFTIISEVCWEINNCRLGLHCRWRTLLGNPSSSLVVDRYDVSSFWSSKYLITPADLYWPPAVESEQRGPSDS